MIIIIVRLEFDLVDLDYYYQVENDEIKEMDKPFETDESKKICTLDLVNEDRTYSGFSYFMDSTRRTYKIGDMVLEQKKNPTTKTFSLEDLKFFLTSADIMRKILL